MRKLIKILFIMSAALCGIGGIVGTLIFLNRNEISTDSFPLRQKWTFDADGTIRTTPIVYKNHVLVRTTTKLYAIDATNGKLIWTFSLPNDQHVDPPLVQNDTVVLSHLRGTTALEFQSGKVIWEITVEESRVDALPVVANEQVVVIVDEFILVHDIRTGDLLWKIQNPHPRSNSVVALNNRTLYVVFTDEIRSYDIENGDLNWNKYTEKWALRSAVSGLFDNDIFYLEQREGGLAAYSLAQERILWSRDDLSLNDYPLTKQDDIIFTSTRGSPPVAINALTGKTIWQSQDVIDFDDYQTPLVFHNLLYVRGVFQNRIYALDIQNGAVLGYIDFGLPDLISTNASYSLGPVQAKDLIVFPVDEKLFAFGK